MALASSPQPRFLTVACSFATFGVMRWFSIARGLGYFPWIPWCEHGPAPSSHGFSLF